MNQIRDARTMKGLILCAGIGSRLAPLTHVLPKCLFDINGKTILQRAIDNFRSNNIFDIIVVTGHFSEKICPLFSDDSHLIFLKNQDYRTTNNMYSFYLAKDYLESDDFISVNGDVVFSPEIIHLLCTKNTVKTTVAVDTTLYFEESMKVLKRGHILTDIRKTISKKDGYGVSIDLYKFNKKDGATLFTIIESFIKNNDTNLWLEEALRKLMMQTAILPVDIGDNLWCEIDTIEDLNRARIKFK